MHSNIIIDCSITDRLRPVLQMCLTFQQSVGIIGGKPNHAHWFIGFLGQ